MQSSQQDHQQQQLLAQKDQMEYQMQLQHNHSHNDDMEADQSLLQKLPSLSNNPNGLIKMDGIYMSDLTMKRGMAPSASGSSLASSDATSRGSVSYDGDEMESQGDHDFDDSFSSQTTSGSMGVSGMVASRGGSLDGSGMMNHDGSSTSPSPSLHRHHQELQDAPTFFKQYSMKSNSPQFNSDAGAMNQTSPSTCSTSPTSNSPSFPTATSPNFSFDKRTGMAGSEGMVEGASPRGSVSSMVSLSPRDVSSNLRSNSYTSSPSQHPQLQSLGGNFISNLYTSPVGAASGTQVNQHRPSLGESLGLTLGQQAAESSSSSRGQPGMMQQAVAEYNSISGSSPLNNGANSIFSPNSYSGSKNRPTPPAKLSLPPLNFFQNAKSGSQFNVPFTPGGSLFYGARDGAASGEPLSPFEPPTPLKRVSGDGRQDSNPMDSPLNRYAKLPSIGSMGAAGQMMGEGGASPSAHAHALSRLQRKRPGLPPALGGMGAVRRASYSPNSSPNSYSVGSIPPYHAMHQQQQEQELQSPAVPISPLRQEFANVHVHVDSTAGAAMEEDLPEKDSDEHMRTLTRSSIDVVMGLRQLNEEPSSSVAAASSSASSYGAQSATSSPSTLSAASMSTTATSNFTPPCSPLTISSALPSTSSTKQKQRSPSPMQTSVDMRRTSSGNKPRAKEALIGSSSNVAQSHSMTTRAKKSVVAPVSVKARSVSPPSLDLPSKGASEKAGEATPMPSSAPPTQTTFGVSIDASPSVSSMTLSPPTETSALPVLRSVPMVKSKTAPAIPNTVSAKHLSTRTLHPHFVSTYDLGDELGSGGFGFVVSAKRRTDGMPVAVKFIWKNKVPSHGWVKDPQLGIVPMEVFVLKVVDCPFVVKFVEAFDDTEFFYLVMEHHGTPWVANTKENKAAAAAAAAASSQGKGISAPPTAPMMQSSKSLPGSSSTPAKPFGGLTPLESPKVAVFAPNSNTPSLTSDSEMSDVGNDSRSSISSSSVSSTGAEAASTAPSRPGMPQRRLSCDLFECIEQHSRLTESRARWVFAQVVEAVYHLDRMGISHRDIKDENCVIDADFNVKLIDFGSAVISDVRKPAPYFNRFFGTMTFASAEILQGKMYRAPNAEIWSLGVLLSILLSGECPFEDPKAAMAGRIGVGKGWSREAKELISGCLDVDPDRRANIGEVREHPWVKRAWKEQGKDRPL